MSIDEAIRVAEEAAQKLREALKVAGLEVVNESDPVKAELERARKFAAEVDFRGVRRALADARRPRGPAVTIEFSSFYASSRQTQPGEVLRRTATQAVVRRCPDGGYPVDDYFKLSDGKPARSGTSTFNGYWRIAEADLEIVRAMPVGENAVSKAAEAIEAGRFDEVKP